MIRKSILFLIGIALLSSCAKDKTFTTSKGNTFVATPYGLGNENEKKIEGVTYDMSMPNVLIGAVLVETIIVPVYVAGWALYQPVGYTEPIKNK